LLGGHQGQVVIGLQVKQVHHLGDHLPVLTGQHHPGVEVIGLLEGLYHRSELDRLRTGSQHDADVVGSAHSGAVGSPLDPKDGGQKSCPLIGFAATLNRQRVADL